MPLKTTAIALLIAASALPALAAPGDMTADQFTASRKAKLMRADADHDGRVSAAEWAAARKGRAAALFPRLDTNGDGYLDAAEIDSRLERRFKRLDANGDGVLGAQEAAAGRKGRDRGGQP